MRKIAITLALLALSATSAFAASAPILSFSRLSFAAGVNKVWVSAGPLQEFYEAGIYTSYNLTPHLSLAHSTLKAFEEDSPWETRVGIRLRLEVPQ